MQQQKMEVASMPLPNSVGVITRNQRTIEIEQTPADRRCQSQGAAESSSQVAPNSMQAMQAVLTNVIGDHRMSPQDPLTDYHFDTDLISTGNFELVNIQWQGAFKLEHNLIEDRYIIWIALAGCLYQKIGLHQTLCCSLDTATIISPGQKLESIASDTGEALLISIDRLGIDSAVSKSIDRASQLNRQYSLLWQSIDDAQSDRVVGGVWHRQALSYLLFSNYPRNEFFHFYYLYSE